VQTIQFRPKGEYKTIKNDPKSATTMAPSGRGFGSSKKSPNIFPSIELAEVSNPKLPADPDNPDDIFELIADLVSNYVFVSGEDSRGRFFTTQYYSLPMKALDNNPASWFTELSDDPTTAWKSENRKADKKIASPWMPNLKPPTDSMIENGEEFNEENPYVVLSEADPGVGDVLNPKFSGVPYNFKSQPQNSLRKECSYRSTSGRARLVLGPGS